MSEIRAVYYPAAEAFIVRPQGATVSSSSTIPSASASKVRPTSVAPARASRRRASMSTRPMLPAPNRVREHLPDEADELLKGRVQVINLWRPIRGPVRDTPLAMLDGRRWRPAISSPPT